jgi:hypothetical protein
MNKLRDRGTVSRRQAPPAMLDGLEPACARARRLASTIRHLDLHILFMDTS